MKILAFTIPTIPMRIPTDKEWARLVACGLEHGGGLDSLINWSDAFFWVNDAGREKSEYRTACGYHYPDWKFSVPAASRSNFFCFRPAFDLPPDILPDLENGERAVVGTLYMGEKPIRVPWNGERPAIFHRCAGPLEMRPALDDPHYQVTAIRADNVLIADRNLLKKISYEDIERLGLAVRQGDSAIPVSAIVQNVFTNKNPKEE